MKTDAEVDEFGVLCVTVRGVQWWAEAACYQPGDVTSVVRIDADNAPLERIHDLEAHVRGLREWCTEGGTAEWLKKS